jgi:stress-induced morphogen
VQRIDIVDHTDASSCAGGAKLDVTVVSDAFAGRMLLQRHRMVNECLQELLASSGGAEPPKIHALTLKTLTPSQVQQ